LLAAASVSTIFAEVGLICRRPATGTSGGRGTTSRASTHLPEGFTVVAAGRTPPLAPNLFLPAVTMKMSDCGGVGEARDGRRRCSQELSRRHRHRRGGGRARTTEAGVFLWSGVRLLKILLCGQVYSSNS
jgi:hypothetical protein